MCTDAFIIDLWGECGHKVSFACMKGQHEMEHVCGGLQWRRKSGCDLLCGESMWGCDTLRVCHEWQSRDASGYL